MRYVQKQIQNKIKRPDSNLNMLRQPAALAAKKRAEKEGEWERLQEERTKLAAEIEAKEVSTASISVSTYYFEGLACVTEEEKRATMLAKTATQIKRTKAAGWEERYQGAACESGAREHLPRCWGNTETAEEAKHSRG